MRIIGESDCRKWITDLTGAPFSWATLKDYFGISCAYRVPAHSGRKAAVAKQLRRQVEDGERDNCLLWVTDWSIFPSSENMHLFDRYRLSFGHSQPIQEAPGHVLGYADAVVLESILDLVLYFCWDASLFIARDVWIEFSHDEHMVVHVVDNHERERVQASLGRLGLERHSL